MSKKKYTKQPQKKRKKRRGKSSKLKKILLIILIAICAILVAGFALLHVKYGINPKTIVQFKIEAKELVANSTVETFRPNKASIVYSDDEEVIAKLYEDEESTYLPFDEIPKDVINAFVSVEDRTFWENSGIDTKGIIRVVFNYVRSGGETAHGASTITQQVARDIFLTNEKSLERKIKEIFIAQEMTKKYEKEQIIEFYCNNCCFANATYGIEDAAQTYLGKPASELTLSEAAYLCSIPNRPEYYDPFDDPTTALERCNKILGDMVECEYITQAECDEAIAEEITVVPEEETEEEFHNYATTLTVKYATEYLMEYKYDFNFQYSFDTQEEYDAYKEEYDAAYDKAKHNLKTGGYQIYTSINLDAMDELQEVLDENLEWSTETKEDGVYNLQGALTVIDNETGKIVAAVGGRSQDVTANMYSLNRAVNSPRQPGSTIKPLIVYAPALEEGYNANSMLVNVDEDEAKGKSASEILKMEGSEVKLRTAVEQSYNGPVYWLASKIGISYGLSFLEEMEFSSLCPNDYNMSSALGGMYYGATTAEMANAYSTLANHGTYTHADCLLSIIDGEGNEIYETPDSKQVYDDDTADQMVDILKGVITRGTASKIGWYSSSNTEAMGKTGTTNSNRDGWFCGSTPYYTIAVWIGSDDNGKVSGLSGSSYPAKIWKGAMLSMIDGLPTASFDLDVPDNLSYSGGSSEETVPEDELTEDEVIDGTTPDGTTPGTDTPFGTDGTTTPSGGTTIDGNIPDGGNNSGGTTIDGNIPGGGNNSGDSDTGGSSSGGASSGGNSGGTSGDSNSGGNTDNSSGGSTDGNGGGTGDGNSSAAPVA